MTSNPMRATDRIGSALLGLARVKGSRYYLRLSAYTDFEPQRPLVFRNNSSSADAVTDVFIP